MGTRRLNKENNFRENVTATVTTIQFLVNGSTADCLVYAPPGGALLGRMREVAAGSVAKIAGVVVGQPIQVQINPKDAKLGNATVTF